MGSIVKFLGGLGNQMFQYAFLEALDKHTGEVNKVDLHWYDINDQHNGFELDRVFGIALDDRVASYYEIHKLGYYECKILSKLMKLFSSHIIDWQSPYESITYNSKVFGLGDNYYIGYWQSEKYFFDISEKIREKFQFQNIDDKNKSLANKLLKSKSVSVHIRRGDYVNNKLYEGICTDEYYNKAMNLAKEILGNDVEFYVFSNDVSWCKSNLTHKNCKFIDYNNGMDSYKDMYLMTRCNINIIANSSFSWWGAWLNTRSDKIVLTPSLWMNIDVDGTIDVVPDRWIRI